MQRVLKSLNEADERAKIEKEEKENKKKLEKEKAEAQKKAAEEAKNNDWVSSELVITVLTSQEFQINWFKTLKR